MPSALETLVKILKLERQQGYKNNAVIGGLAAYGANWQSEAHQQARKPEHHVLVNELVDLLKSYDDIENKTERHDAVTYMMDRITGRQPAPAEYQSQDSPPPELELQQASQTKSQARTVAPSTHDKAQTRPEHQSMDDSPSSADDQDASASTRRSRQAPVYRPASDDQPRLARPPRQPRRPIDPDEAADIMRGLEADVTNVKGVGPQMAQSLAKLGISNINDLLFFLPRRYDDYTRLAFISKLMPGITATVIGSVIRSEVRVGRGGRKDFYIELDDGSAVLPVMFFGQHFLSRQIRPGKQLVLSGQTSMFRGQVQMSNPEWEEVDAENLHTVGIIPVYPLTEKLGARKMRRLMKDTIEYWADRIPDYIPQPTLDRTELGDLGWALQNLHFPESADHLEHARRRHTFDQLLLMQLSILANRRDWQSVPGHALHVEDGFLESFLESVFPFPLTSAQRRAIEDARRDIASDVPMNRLLQGDVGSGKTAVAMTALAMAFKNGKQAALMAPTSILAEQHHRGITEAFKAYPDEQKPVIGMLTSALSNSERETIYSALADGSIDIIIGTHALIQGGVEFKDLALAVIDEQHRFGVGQRRALRSKGHNPHLLVMTATPIPRTLALTLYADLDLSVMDEMPPGREPVDTRVMKPLERERIYSFIENQIEQGRQAFVVYPLVEASETSEAESATEAYEKLSEVFFRHRVGLLHGRMKPAEKDDIMGAFAKGEFDVLVTTSVAEVGVDIPNASVIVIEGANRFGLAQLHQFRGRVGRGQHKSYCLLIPDATTPEADERLKAMESTTDGFKLAEIDWKLRGPGDLVGTRQSGRTLLQLAAAITPELVALAQREARTIYEEDAYLQHDEHKLLAQRVEMLHNEQSDVS